MCTASEDEYYKLNIPENIVHQFITKKMKKTWRYKECMVKENIVGVLQTIQNTTIKIIIL